MTTRAVKFAFGPDVRLEDAEQALAISAIAVEAIHGEAAMMVEGKFTISKERRICLIDAETSVGQDLARVFAGFLVTSQGWCFRTEMVETRVELGDMVDLFERFI